MAPSDAVEKARALLEARRRELREELEQIDAALAGLGGRRRGPGRPRGSTAAAAPAPQDDRGGKRRRRRRGGTRAEHALSHVSANPGATASEIATAMGIKPNYVYRVMAELEKDGRVSKQGKGYFATGDDAAESGPAEETQAPPAAPAETVGEAGSAAEAEAGTGAQNGAGKGDQAPEATEAVEAEQPAPAWERTSPLR